MSILGNPFPLSHESERDKVCDKYQEYFDDPKTREMLKEALKEILKDAIKGQRVILGCFCSPKRCHCDTIANYLNVILQKLEGW